MKVKITKQIETFLPPHEKVPQDYLIFDLKTVIYQLFKETVTGNKIQVKEIRNSEKPLITFHVINCPIPFGIFKGDYNNPRGLIEETVYQLATICKVEKMFVPSRSVYFANCLGVVQPFRQGDHIQQINKKRLLNGDLKISFRTLIETIVCHMQFGFEDVIKENLLFNSLTRSFLHFDNEHALPSDNEMGLENDEEATPKLRSVLLAHPLAYITLEGIELGYLYESIKLYKDSEEEISKYFYSKKNLFESNSLSWEKVLESWGLVA